MALIPDTTRDARQVIVASSLGTIFEWYDFYLYGSLAGIIGAQFFSGVNPTAGFIFALLAFAAGFAVRPFGALVFGRLGDLVGRKHTFLVTILLMGVSTFIVGILPSYAQIGIAAPIILILLRLLQGLALGGEYGGAATYVAEHAPPGERGSYTSWIQTTATMGLFLSFAGDHHLPCGARGRGVRRMGVAHPLLGLARVARDLGLDPARARGVARLQGDEGGGDVPPRRRSRNRSAPGRICAWCSSRSSDSRRDRRWSGTRGSSTPSSS